MSLALISACLWLIAANVIGLVPSKKKHWPQAYALIAFGLPILVWVALADGPWFALLVLAAAASILRWPVLFFLRWLSTLAGRQAEG